LPSAGLRRLDGAELDQLGLDPAGQVGGLAVGPGQQQDGLPLQVVGQPHRGGAVHGRVLVGADQACAAFSEASAAAVARGSTDTIVACESQLALRAVDRGEWPEAAGRLELALATIDENRMHDYVSSLLAFAGAARLSVHYGDLNQAHRQLARAMRARPAATYVLPYVAVRLRLQLAKAHLAIADVAAARQLLREIDDVLIRRPALGTLVDEVKEFRRVLVSSVSGAAGGLALTPAELRLLPYLQTHLTADRIAERLFVSSWTAKTEIKSIYRKLGVSSRNDAVQKATTIGLVGAEPTAPPGPHGPGSTYPHWGDARFASRTDDGDDEGNSRPGCHRCPPARGGHGPGGQIPGDPAQTGGHRRRLR
jgi:ATP/maltotriose-dependent transcriptional regulator MalT